jgi:hypothetical protein
MTRYVISFDDGAMTFPEEELPDAAEAAHAVVQEADDAGVWVFGGGLKDHEEASVVATDGTVTDGPYAESKQYLGGFAVVHVPSREEALQWAAKFAVACRCAQEVVSSCPTLPSDRRPTMASSCPPLPNLGECRRAVAAYSVPAAIASTTAWTPLDPSASRTCARYSSTSSRPRSGSLTLATT